MGGGLEIAVRDKMNALQNSDGALAKTRPSQLARPLDEFQLVHIGNKSPKKKGYKSGCLLIFLPLFLLLFYFFAPFPTNFLVLGVDAGLGRGELGRTDTIILGRISPTMPYVGLLSIPRDLWVNIPDVGENRINTAYFFAEVQKAGDGPRASLATIQQNFHVSVSYYVILRMDGLSEIIDAMDGVEISLSEPMAGYAVGVHRLDGPDALAFARNRAGADDFSRMSYGQILLKGIMRRLMQPSVWPHFSEIYHAIDLAVDTNIPLWHWPRLLLAVLRTGPDGIDSHTITRDMVQPFTTDQGAQVLAPQWDKIDLLVESIFGK